MRLKTIMNVAMVTAIVCALFAVSAFAQHGEPQHDMKIMKDAQATAQHSITIGGQKINYTSTTGTIVLRTEEGDPRATIFYMAFTKNGIDNINDRPLTFSFNGGPGSSSVWLHLGLLGPRRVVTNDDGSPTPPPYRLEDNDLSLLDETDLVFIDPVMTGYSRNAPGVDRSDFHGLEEDVESVSEFIRLYIVRNERWLSPKFLIGESYGTTRAAGLSGYLQDRSGIYLNGIMLVSSILNFQTARFDIGNDTPYILFLPTYSAIAWYHKQLAPVLQNDLRATLDEVEEFALNQYTTALMKGAALPDAERQDVIKKLAKYTGLSEEYIDQTNLRINIGRFVKELRRDEGLTVGRLDGRFTGLDRDHAGEGYEFDPSMAAIRGSYTATLNSYVRSELGFTSDLPYEILGGRVRPWSYKNYENRYINVSETLRGAMTVNRDLKVYVANGYYDLATPYFATAHTFNHMELTPELRKNVTMGYFEAGHMMYIHKPSFVRLKADLAKFIKDAK